MQSPNSRKINTTHNTDEFTKSDTPKLQLNQLLMELKLISNGKRNSQKACHWFLGHCAEQGKYYLIDKNVKKN